MESLYDVYSNEIWIRVTILCCAIVPRGKIDKSKLLCSTIRNTGNFGDFIVCLQSFDEDHFMYIPSNAIKQFNRQFKISVNYRSNFTRQCFFAQKTEMTLSSLLSLYKKDTIIKRNLFCNYLQKYYHVNKKCIHVCKL